MNIFVTGTDTDVGKTFVSAWICLHTGATYWKPIQTGMEMDRDFVANIAKKSKILDEVYHLKAPLSAYDAANIENTRINRDVFFENIPDHTIIEGAGGVLVPISENFMMADLMKDLNACALVVAKSRLGFLNHIFLTVEALKARNINILGIVVNGKTDKIATIEKFTNIEVLANIPHIFDTNLSDNLLKIDIPQRIREILL